MHTKRSGTQGEMLVCEDLLSRGYEVFVPVGDYSTVDIIALKDGHTLKFQVKTNVDTSSGTACAGISRVRNGQRKVYELTEFDYLAICALDRKLVAYVPVSEFISKTSISLRFEPIRNRNKVGRFFSEFQTLALVSALPSKQLKP